MKGTKVLCSLDLLVEVFVSKCQHLGCQQQTSVGYKCALEMALSIET